MSVRFVLAALLIAALPATASNLVTNGSFSTTTSGAGQLGYNTAATGWSTTGYNFLFTSAANATSGTVTGSDGALALDGPGNGYANGLINSPDGGNFIANDGAYEVGALTQTISGLTALANYTVSFYWAAAQQNDFGCVTPANPGGCTTSQWRVSLGSQTQSTAVASTGVNKGGFSGWMYQTFTFTATSSSEVLSFLAVGTPSGEPPFALLDGVSLNAATPEPGTFMLMAGAVLIGLGGFARRKQKGK